MFILKSDIVQLKNECYIQAANFKINLLVSVIILQFFFIGFSWALNLLLFSKINKCKIYFSNILKTS